MPNYCKNSLYVDAKTPDELRKFIETVKSDESDFDFNKIVFMPEELGIVCGSCTDEGRHMAELIQFGVGSTAYYSEPSDYDFDDFVRAAERRGISKDKAQAIFDKCVKIFADGGSRDDVRIALGVSKDKYLEYKLPDTLEVTIALGFQVLDNLDDFGFDTWYDWCCENWGTKWNAIGVVTDYSDGKVHCYIDFDTAWCEPTPIFNALARMFPNLELRATWIYEEDFGRYAEEEEFVSGFWHN